MPAETVTQAVAKRDGTPTGLIKQYMTDFATVLPSHIRADTWVRVAQGALKKGRKQGQLFELEIAAANNPAVFLASLLDAARLGLEPGTEQYYLTPRKVGGRLEILGIVGYQGHIELMYRAGAVSSIVAEVVRERDDYRYNRGVDEVPVHRFTPFASAEVRGKLVGVYAYARMKDGAVSRVVEMGADDIDRIKASSQGAKSEYSPWVNHEVAMWLKSAVRQLQKWVPTSAEYRQQAADRTAVYHQVAEDRGLPLPTEDVVDGEVVGPQDAEPVDAWPAVAEPGGQS
jgi:recombination protein RecT